jgi:hypothetical protein
VAWARTMREHGVPALQLLWKKVQSWLVSFSSKNLISIMINMKTKVYVLALYTILASIWVTACTIVQDQGAHCSDSEWKIVKYGKMCARY